MFGPISLKDSESELADTEAALILYSVKYVLHLDVILQFL